MALKFNIKPGQKVCPRCEQKLKSTELNQDIPVTPPHVSECHFDEPSIEEHNESLNDSMQTLECSPIKLNFETVENAVAYGKRKVKKVNETVAKKVARTINVSSDLIMPEVSNAPKCNQCTDFEVLMNQLIEKCKNNKHNHEN